MSVKHTTQNFYVTEAWNDDTLSNIAGNYFIAIDEDNYTNINMPDPVAMSGETLNFVYTNNNGESAVTLNGNINNNGSNTYMMNYPQSVTFISDGTTWWIVATNNDN